MAAQIQNEKASLNIATPSNDETSLEFFKVIYPNSGNMTKILDTTKRLGKKGQEIIDVFCQNKPVSLAFRKACAYGALSIVQIMLEDRTLLDNFDVNEESSNGKTALDWINDNKTLNENRKEIIRKLLRNAGALTAQEKKLLDESNNNRCSLSCKLI